MMRICAHTKQSFPSVRVKSSSKKRQCSHMRSQSSIIIAFFVAVTSVTFQYSSLSRPRCGSSALSTASE